MIIELEEPFKSLWKKGYLRHSKVDNRKRVDLFNTDNDRTTISYAKYLVCVDMGSLITDDYEVDHIDNDCTNDDLNNLQVITISAHREKTSKERSTGRTMVELVCSNCNKTFSREKRLVHKGAIPKCSRRCNAQYNHKHNGWGRAKKSK